MFLVFAKLCLFLERLLSLSFLWKCSELTYGQIPRTSGLEAPIMELTGAFAGYMRDALDSRHATD